MISSEACTWLAPHWYSPNHEVSKIVESYVQLNFYWIGKLMLSSIKQKFQQYKFSTKLYLKFMLIFAGLIFQYNQNFKPKSKLTCDDVMPQKQVEIKYHQIFRSPGI